MKSVMSHNFAQVPKAEIQRSSFDRSHGFKTTFNSGELVPFYVDEVLPGDTFNLNATTFARLATPIVPFMDNLFADTFYFFVPNRLVWDNWEKFNGAQDNPGDSTSFVIPTLDYSSGVINPTAGSLNDYFGLPINVIYPAQTKISALPFRAYNLIWNEWFRDENLQNSLVISRGNGPDAAAYSVLRRGKRHDYFTSCLPWPQKGTAVTLPLGTSAPIAGLYVNVANSQAIAGVQQVGPLATGSNSISGVGAMYAASKSAAATAAGTAFNTTNANVYADLSTATAATINAIREAFQIQRLYERDARGGTRYVEILLAHFGVSAPDFRLQRPEYLGGTSTKINVNPVAQTSVTAATPQGNLAATGTFSHTSRNGFSKSFVEHGYVFGLINVRADLTYQQTLNKMWSRQTRFDFYWPALAHLGEQSVLNKELFFGAVHATNELVFGYQERFAEYRSKNSLITGLFRSNNAVPLDMWHLSQKYTAVPLLNNTFIQEAPPISRVIAVPTAPEFLLDVYLSLTCARPMPTYSVPGLIDHF